MADSNQCGPYVDLPVATFTHGQYCARGAANSICYGKSKKHIHAFSGGLRILSSNFSGMDCRIFPDSCGDNASCVNTTLEVEARTDSSGNELPTYYSHQCECDSGYIGNGFLCTEEPTDCETVCCDSSTSSLGIEEDFCECDDYSCPTTEAPTTTAAATSTAKT